MKSNRTHRNTGRNACATQPIQDLQTRWHRLSSLCSTGFPACVGQGHALPKAAQGAALRGTPWLAVGLFLAQSLTAQIGGGSIIGFVTDTSKAVVPGAEVKA